MNISHGACWKWKFLEVSCAVWCGGVYTLFVCVGFVCFIKGCLFLTVCVLLSPTVRIFWTRSDQQQTEDYSEPNPGEPYRYGEWNVRSHPVSLSFCLSHFVVHALSRVSIMKLSGNGSVHLSPVLIASHQAYHPLPSSTFNYSSHRWVNHPRHT